MMTYTVMIKINHSQSKCDICDVDRVASGGALANTESTAAFTSYVV